MARWFCDNTVDIAFLSKTTLENEDISGAYNMIPIHRDQIMCVVPKTFVPKNNVYATAEDIADFPLVMQRTGYDQETLYVLKKYNLKSSSNFHIADDNSIIAMVEAGLGICIMPELVCKSSTCNVDIYPFFPEEYRTIMLLVRNSQQQMPAVSKMQHQILNYLQENGLMNC